MMSRFVVPAQPVYLLGRQQCHAARAGASKIPAHLAVALQQQAAVGRRQAPAQAVRLFDPEAFHLVGRFDDRPVGERRHEAKAPPVPGPKSVDQGDAVALARGEDARPEDSAPMMEEEPTPGAAPADRLEPDEA